MDTTDNERDPVDVAYDVFNRNCPSRATLDDVTGRWGLLVLVALLDGTARFSALRRRVDGVSEKMLSQALQALERDGLVTRTQRSMLPPVVDYELTNIGTGAAQRGAQLLEWLESSMSEISAAQERYDNAGGRAAALGGPPLSEPHPQ